MSQTQREQYRLVRTNMPTQVLLQGGKSPNAFSIQINITEGERILKAVNSHDELVEALEICKRALHDRPDYHLVVGSDVTINLGMIIEKALLTVQKEG